MDAIRYEAPTSIADAVALLAQPGGVVHVLAGGTDLLVQMRNGVAEPGLIVDVKRIPELLETRAEDGGFVIGAAACAADVRDVPGLRDAYPGVTEAVHLIGSEQIQGRASIGGNLCNASPAADSVPALIAATAEAIVRGPSGERTIQVEDFVTGPGSNALATGEMLVAVRLPPAGHARDAYLRLIPRTEMDIAVVGVGVRLAVDGSGRCTEARVALGAVAPRPLLVSAAADALVGTTLDDAALAAAGQAASAACDPIDDKRGTIEYRRKVAGVLTRRAATTAAERARRALQ